MNRLISLLAAFVFVFSLNAFADNHDQLDDLDRHNEKIKAHEQYKQHIKNLSEKEKEYLRSEIKAARQKCVSECRVDRKELQECRKKIEKADIRTTRSTCLNKKDRACMKTCVKQAKKDYKQSKSGRY